jgi:steroid 5-alpha reductase family enzyme
MQAQGGATLIGPCALPIVSTGRSVSLPAVAGRREWSKPGSIAVLGGLYAVALGVGFLAAEAAVGMGPLAAALLGDLAATGVVFVGSVALDNTSVYDPYWSVVPLPLALWWYFHPGPPGAADPVRFALAASLLGLWGVRLTANFLRGWGGLGHEDWRYAAYRRLGPIRYRLVSLGGLQLLPTLIVFAALLPVHAVTRGPGHAAGSLDVVAAVVALAALVLEAVADEQKHRWRGGARPGGFVASGVWAWCRHPNYLGEVAFWWGIWGFAIAAGWGYAWTVGGAVAMALLFRLVSVPLMDRRMAGRHPGYAAFAGTLPALLPIGRRRTGERPPR